MKTLAIGSLVGGIILFLWQFLSWSLLGIHNPQMAYTPNQDAIIEALGNNLEEAGTYFVPRAPEGATMAEEEAFGKKMTGQPWAIVSYRKSFNANMGMNMVRGLIIDLLAVLLLGWILMKIPNLDFQTPLIVSLAVGLIGYLTISYLNTIWFEGSSFPDLIDAIVSWGAVGAWLGYWLPRSNKVAR